MKSPIKNPYHPVVEDGAAFFPAQRVFDDLDGRLLNVEEPSPLSIISEEGLGGIKVISLYLKSRKDQLPYRIVECDMRHDLRASENAGEFYRALVNYVVSRITTSEKAIVLAKDINDNKSLSSSDLEENVRLFFKEVLIDNPRQPLLLVFYSFDEMPKRHQMHGDDLSLLRQLYIDLHYRVYYIIHSRRPIDSIEKQYKIISHFNTIFPSPLRLGLLNEQEATDLICQPAREKLGQEPWEPWLIKLILRLSGGNQAIIETTCFYLFDQIWNRDAKYSEHDIGILIEHFYGLVTNYFQRIYDHMEKELIETLVVVVQFGYKAERARLISELLLLGYLVESAKESRQPSTSAVRQIRLSSPLFQRYVVERSGIAKVPDPTGPLSLGDFLGDGRYEIIGILETRHNSNSWVYKAIDRKAAGRVVAIKEPNFFYDSHLSSVDLENRKQSLKNEVAILAKAKHAYIANLFEFIDERYLVQEWVEGSSLRSYVATPLSLSIPRILAYAIQVCTAMEHVYNTIGCRHRDIKPEHIYIASDGFVRIIDFGLAKIHERRSSDYRSVKDDFATGTFDYMSPEQFRGEDDCRSDIYSLGVTLFQTITGRLPYTRGSLETMYTKRIIPPPASMHEIRSEINEALERAVLKAFRHEPEDRYQTWGEFKQALLEVERNISQ